MQPYSNRFSRKVRGDKNIFELWTTIAKLGSELIKYLLEVLLSGLDRSCIHLHVFASFTLLKNRMEQAVRQFSAQVINFLIVILEL